MHQFGAFTKWVFMQIERYPTVGTLLILLIMDFICGIMIAITAHRLSAAKAAKGVTRKVYTVLLVGVAAVFEPYTSGMPLTKIVALFYCATEAISILKNAAVLGIPLPKPLVEILEKVRDANDDTTKVKITKTEVELDLPHHHSKEKEHGSGLDKGDSVGSPPPGGHKGDHRGDPGYGE